MKITGHRNEKSLDDYDESDEIEQRQLSNAISGPSNNCSETNIRGRGSSSQFAGNFTPFASNSAPNEGLCGAPFPPGFSVCPPNVQLPNDQKQCFMNMNSFTNCQVTFNMGNSAPEIKPSQ